MVTTSSSSKVNVGPKVFINFRGAELRRTFVCHLYDALHESGINAFIDSDEDAGQELEILFKRIEESKIALVILSSRYTESQWCLNELVKMTECSKKGEGCKNLLVIPIFYKLKPSIVAELEGDFGVNLLKLWTKQGCDRDDRIVKWNKALQDVGNKMALVLEETGCREEDAAFLNKIVINVKNALERILSQSQENPKPHNLPTKALNYTEPGEKRLKQLEEKLDVDRNDNETRIVGVVGMAGIGKTYLAKKLFVKLQTRVVRHVFIKFDDGKSKDWLQKTLVEGLLKKDHPGLTVDGENSLEIWKDCLIQKKFVAVFDNVSDQKQIEPLLVSCEWITKGSTIVITTRDKSLTEGLVCEVYEVPGLNERDGLELFRAQLCSNSLEGNFVEMSRKFLDYAGGNPLAIRELGKELKGKNEGYWKSRLGTLTQVSNDEIRKVLRNSYENDLDEKQKDAFLDIVCFFRSHDQNCVTSLLDSIEQQSSEAGREVGDLVDKFLIHISSGRVEMQDLVFTMGKELVETNTNEYWLLSSNCAVSTLALIDKKGRDKVRGIVLDMSKMKEMPLDKGAFVGMTSLRYLKVYNSLCPMHCEAHCHKLNLPDVLEFPKDNIVRYLDWMNFPGKELPSDFEPKNLIDLRLPYSNITSVWSCPKVAPNLKWVDLSH